MSNVEAIISCVEQLDVTGKNLRTCLESINSELSRFNYWNSLPLTTSIPAGTERKTGRQKHFDVEKLDG